MIDPDNDIVKCELSQYTEKGELPDTPGVHIHKEVEKGLSVTIYVYIKL
jgi:hypothetical protein